jgi:tyrosine-protein phosphatase SIW14
LTFFVLPLLPFTCTFFRLPFSLIAKQSALRICEGIAIITPMTRKSLSQGGIVRNISLGRWAAGVALVAFMIYAPYLYYRYTLEHSKRLRPVVEGEVYRSGCLTANGFRDAIQKHGIKTVISFWDENPDPTLYGSRFDWSAIKESDLCKSMDVNYKFIFVKLRDKGDPAVVIKEFLDIMDDKTNYPVLFHCKAGLHRTGVMAAIYRMEYDGWSRQDAMRELRAHGFGYYVGNTSNDYIEQYIMHYQPRGQHVAARKN